MCRIKVKKFDQYVQEFSKGDDAGKTIMPFASKKWT